MKNSGSNLIDVKIHDRELLTLKHMIKEMAQITRKLKQLPQMRDRFEIERPNVSITEMADRLIKKRKR